MEMPPETELSPPESEFQIIAAAIRTTAVANRRQTRRNFLRQYQTRRRWTMSSSFSSASAP